MSEQNLGLKFEEELASEFGLDRVPGSGSTWHSKLDLKGNNARWSLKATDKFRWPISARDIYEAKERCLGLGGDGATPIWAARIQGEDYIVLRKEDFKLLQAGEIKFINQNKSKSSQREARSRVPSLLREES